MNKVIAVHSTFSRNWIFLSGFWISGRILQKGFTNSRNLTKIIQDIMTIYWWNILKYSGDNSVHTVRRGWYLLPMMNEYQSTSFPQIFLKTSNYFWILRSPCVLDSEWLIWQTAALNVIYSTSLGSSVFCFLFWRCLIVQYRHNWWYFLLSLIWRIFNALSK